MRAAYKTRREPSCSGRRAFGYNGRAAGQRSVPSGCRVKAEPGKPPVNEGRANFGGPYCTGGVCFLEGAGSRAEAGQASDAGANSVVCRSEGVGGHHQADLRSGWGQGNGPAIVERTRHSTCLHGYSPDLVRLENNRAGAYDFSPFEPLIPRGTHLIKTTMGSGQRL
jgi:hypothetical protein